MILLSSFIDWSVFVCVELIRDCKLVLQYNLSMLTMQWFFNCYSSIQVTQATEQGQSVSHQTEY